jgi:hypothetical protein
MWHVSYFNPNTGYIYHQFLNTIIEAVDTMDWAENHNFMGIMVQLVR